MGKNANSTAALQGTTCLNFFQNIDEYTICCVDNFSASFLSPSLSSPSQPPSSKYLSAVEFKNSIYVTICPPHSSYLSITTSPSSLHPFPLPLTPAVSRAVGQAERDDNATVIRRETNTCGKRRWKESRTIHHFEIRGDNEVCGALKYKMQVGGRERESSTAPYNTYIL